MRIGPAAQHCYPALLQRTSQGYQRQSGRSFTSDPSKCLGKDLKIQNWLGKHIEPKQQTFLLLVKDLPSSLTISGKQERRAFPWETSSIALISQSRAQRTFQRRFHLICYVQYGGTSTSTASSEFEAIHGPINSLIRHSHMLNRV